MKYRQRLVSSSTPASLQEWLAEELERRGIDGVYTRYILSLLLADTIDSTECAHFPPQTSRTPQCHHVSESKIGDNSRHRRLKSWEHEKRQQGFLVPQCQQHKTCCDCCQPYLDNEQRKKLAAVECLKSASEQKGGIENLIDEVCAKLKNLQADIETNPDAELHAQIKCGSKQSSSQGQAELYYAAFPALIGKTEPLSELCDQSQLLQPETWNLNSNTWGKENHVWKIKPLDVQQLAQAKRGEDSDAYSEKENLRDDASLPQQAVSKESDFLENVETATRQPLFIVPKMKVPPTKVANITMYTPFTSAANYQQHGVGGKVAGEEDAYSDEGEEENVNGEGAPLLGERECVPWGLLSPNGKAEENDLVTDLVRKFNSELAAIWETDGSIQEPLLDEDNLGFSFSILSVQSPVQEEAIAPTSINLFIGSSLPSVWSANTEDIKMLCAHDSADPLNLPSSAAISIPSLLHNLTNHILAEGAERRRDDSVSLLWSSEEDSDFFLDDGSSLKSFKLDLSEQAWEDISQACEASSMDDRNTHFVCPESLYVDPEENDRPASVTNSSDCLSPLESPVGMVTGIYSLWETPSPQPPFPLKGDVLHLPLTTTPYSDKVVSWISNQQQLLKGNWLAELPTCKDNRKLTYHKGESCFKEVVPTGKMKEDLEHAELCDGRCSLHLQDGGEDKLEEPEENLLTSPKTHFQPIRQSSSESDSLSDTLEGLDTLSSPNDHEHHHHHHHHRRHSPLIVLTPPVTEEDKSKDDEAKLGRSVSSSMDEMLLLTGQFEPDSSSEMEDSPNTIDMLQAFQSEFKPELMLLQDKSTNTDTLYAAVETNRDELDLLGFGPFRSDQIWSSDSLDEQGSELTLPWKWSTTSDSEDVIWKGDEDDTETENAFEDDLFLKKSALDCTLEAMRKELEEEEEELFRDINLLSDSEDYEAAFGEGFSLFSVEEGLAPAELEASGNEEGTGNASVVDHWKLEAELANNFLGDSKDDNSEMLKLPSIPIDKVLYSSELESEWHKASENFNLQLPKKGKSKIKMAVPQQQNQQQQHRKPCSFFLEGNCRRSDCKFSHNLASITCRFWEEGSCFKGVTCPFLHGYSSDAGLGLQNGGKCKFALESEADFPSLSTLSSSESSCKSFSKDVAVGRIIRPKKKKVGSVAAPASKKSSSPSPK